MVAPKRQISTRGASLLSALAFVAILSGVTAGLQYFAPLSNPRAQTATVPLAEQAGINDINKTAPAPDSSAIPECSAVRKELLTEKAEKAEKESCVCLDKKERAFRRVYYKIEAVLQKNGNPAAKTTARISNSTTASSNWQCEITKCAPNGGKCVTSSLNSTDLATNLADTQKRLIEEYPKAIAIAITDGRIKASDLNGQLSKPTQEAIASAFQSDVKSSYVPNALEPYSSKVLPYNNAELTVAEDEIKNLKTCGETTCPVKLNPSLADAVTTKPDNTKEDTRKDPAPVPPPVKPPVTTGCTGANCSTFNPGPSTVGNPTGGGSNPMSALGSLLSGLSNAFRPTPPQPQQQTPQACQTDPNAYAQQQQQYQQALQQYNYQMQQQQYQQQLAQYQNGGYGAPSAPLPAQPVPCSPSTGNQCQSQPQQPPAATCSGNWRAQYNGPCIVHWICDATNTPTATLTCDRELADVGQEIGFTYNCSSGTATSSSFRVTTQPGGSASTTVANPPRPTNTATYTLACTEGGRTGGDHCSVRVNRPTIILVANPRTVTSASSTSLLSWLTTGMDSCVISSPDQADFTARNSSNTSVTGAATTSPITGETMFQLDCVTLAGGDKQATTTVLLAP